MDIRKVKKLIELLEESGVTEIEVCEGEESVRISRQVSGTAQQTVVQVPEVVASQPTAMNVTPVASEAAAFTAAVEEEEGHIINAPMVGIFYASAGPGEAPFASPAKPLARVKYFVLLRP